MNPTANLYLMTKQCKFFILYRTALLIGLLLLIYFHSPILIIVCLVIGLAFARKLCDAELKNLSPYGGLANWVTFFRGFFLLLLLFFFSYCSNLQIALVGLLLSAADVFDGYLARRLQAETKMGAYLDEDVDALYIICIGYILYTKQLCGFYILLPAFVKYAKDITVTFFANFFCKPIKMPVAKWIAGISFLIYLTPFIFTGFIYPFLTKGSSIALCISLVAEMTLRFGRLSKNK